eukprot:662950-Pleurochrysis_carterae.AAC.5
MLTICRTVAVSSTGTDKTPISKFVSIPGVFHLAAYLSIDLGYLDGCGMNIYSESGDLIACSEARFQPLAGAMAPSRGFPRKQATQAPARAVYSSLHTVG